MIATGALTVAEGAAAGARILQRPRRDWPDALFAANDLLALGLLQGLIVDGRMLVPDDIAIIGFDDIAFAAAAAVPLSSMRQPSGMIGRTALRVLLEETSDPDLHPASDGVPARAHRAGQHRPASSPVAHARRASSGRRLPAEGRPVCGIRSSVARGCGPARISEGW